MPTNIWPGREGLRSGLWAPIESKIFTGAAQTFDFVTVLADTKYTGYRLRLLGKNGYNGVGVFRVRINGANPAGSHEYFYTLNTTIGYARTSAFAGVLAQAPALNDCIWTEFFIPHSIANLPARPYEIRSGVEPDNDATALQEQDFGYLTTPLLATEITSIGVGHNQVNGIAVGSLAYLEGRVT